MKKIQVIDDPLMTPEQVASFLEIPVIATGQLLFDNKVKPGPALTFYREEIVHLKKNEPSYLNSLK